MIIKTGNLFNKPFPNKVVLIATTNAVIRGQTLVMGAGAAKDMVTFNHDAPRLAYEAIVQKSGTTDLPVYGYLRILDSDVGLGIFQTKKNYSAKSEIDLIKISCEDLIEDALNNHQVEFRLNYPGIGLGGLSKQDVSKYVEKLPDNVIVFEK